MKRIKKLNYLVMAAFLVAGSFIIMSMSDGVLQNWPVPAEYKTKVNPKKGKGDPDGVGKALYKQHCESCHGVKAAGDGKKAAALKSEMLDWAKPTVQSQTDGELYYKSYIGKGEMPNFVKKIPAEGDKWLLINYIRTFKK